MTKGHNFDSNQNHNEFGKENKFGFEADDGQGFGH